LIFVIGVCGGTASGKTSVCHRIESNLTETESHHRVAIISLDSFYRALTPDQISNAHAGNHDFDHPDSFDFDLLEQVLTDLRAGKAVQIPHYDFKTHSRHPSETTTISGCDIIILEGIMIFHHKRITDLMHMKVFVDTDSDLRLARRVKRDIRERGRDVDGILYQYERFVKPSFDIFVYPSKKVADLVVPWNDHNLVAVDLLSQHIRHQLDLRQQLRASQENEVNPSTSTTSEEQSSGIKLEKPDAATAEATWATQTSKSASPAAACAELLSLVEV